MRFIIILLATFVVSSSVYAKCTGDQIAKMIDAGFSKDEIQKLCNPDGGFPKRWEIEEGSGNFEWQGYWLVQEDGSFTGTQRKGAESMSIAGTLVRTGNQVFVDKPIVSDDNPCQYRGTISNGQVTGTYFCKSGGPYNWRGVVPN